MGGPKRLITPEVEAEIRRLVTRFAIERVAAGWSVWDLAKESGVSRSNIERFEAGATWPMLPTLVGLGRILGLRLDVVPAHLQPLLALDEFETRALIAFATAADGNPEWDNGFTPQQRRSVRSALRKIGVQSGGDEVDVD